ncbi:Mug G,T/U mismatch-specific DNA glycosylase [Acidimicrobiia bacterium]
MDTIKGRRPSKDELQSFQGAKVDDLLADPLRLLFVGINPGLWTAAVNAHFARPGNRFWPALHRAGITEHVVDVSTGLPNDARAELAAVGIGISNIVPIATARAAELTAAEIRAGGEHLRQLVRDHQPAVVAVLGVTAYRQAFGNPKIGIGRSDKAFEGAELWVLPNPSGLNAHETVETLADWYGQAAEAAGIPRHK